MQRPRFSVPVKNGRRTALLQMSEDVGSASEFSLALLVVKAADEFRGVIIVRIFVPQDQTSGREKKSKITYLNIHQLQRVSRIT